MGESTHEDGDPGFKVNAAVRSMEKINSLTTSKNPIQRAILA